jgi:hypothetical protein
VLGCNEQLTITVDEDLKKKMRELKHRQLEQSCVKPLSKRLGRRRENKPLLKLDP